MCCAERPEEQLRQILAGVEQMSVEEMAAFDAYWSLTTVKQVSPAA